MSTIDSTSAATGKDAPPSSPSTPVVPPRPFRVWGFTLCAAILAGLGAFLVHEKVGMRTKPTENLVRIMGQLVNNPTAPAVHRAERKNAAVAFGILGGCLALAVGLAGGLAQGSPRSGAIAAIVGLLLGASVGAAAAVVVLPIYHKEVERAPELEADMLVQPILTHSAIWAAIGAVTGTALAIGLGRPRLILSTLVGGLVGGVVAATAYEIFGSLVFLMGTSDAVSPNWLMRLTVALAGSFFVAIFAIFAAVAPVSRQRKPRTMAEVGT
jgi:hypothetical protein